MSDALKLTKKNIEDWDFRGVEPGSEADAFLSENYTLVVAIDLLRLSWIKAMVDVGLANLSDGGEYAVVCSDAEALSNPKFYNRLQPGEVPKPSSAAEAKFGFFEGFNWSRARDFLRSDTRFEMSVKRSLLRERKKYGRLKVRLLPNEQEDEEYRRTIEDGAAVYGEWNVDDEGGRLPLA